MRVLLSVLMFMFYIPLACAQDEGDCPQYKNEIIGYLESEGVSSDYYYLAVCESRCRFKTSNKGARGFYQLMTGTFKSFKPDYCENIEDIECNVRTAARYIKHLQERFPSIRMVVKAYNRGGSNLIRKGTTKEADNLSSCVLGHIQRKSK